MHPTPTLSRADAEDLLIREAELLDTLQLEQWLELFTSDGMYWIPLDPSEEIGLNAAIICDDTLRREERVYHLLHVDFPAQSPRSRTVHMVGNVRVLPHEEGALVRSNQVIYEMRMGDSAQVGVAEIQPLVATVEHICRVTPSGARFVRKTITLMNHDAWLGNLTFLL
ncbi:2-halobenzoate 1,2-dioxygenase small subunit [Pigmentiphaga humi]|uniref:2-halobenzoate 1,2-dioxygenase small subunit n=1 Tax=Pigmentiphaga humi TaxID=2478468 RepID=A0A3P4B192_9BURK|nr:aromatic-ring-hydroxylating dioxygenase subunit beta [Pigmentiphaga humi]VCU69428.1 2-halobenzoate 1,2-dioxygenase small subunit [Pigmentiphaga humi]